MSGVELAEALDKGRSTITDWVKKGCPRNKDGTFDLAPVEDWRLEQASGAAEGESWEEEGQKWRALKHKFDLEAKQGLYILTETAAAWWEDRIVEMRTALQSLGASLAPSLVGQDVATIRSLVNERCRSIAEAFARQIEDSLADDDNEAQEDS